MSQEKCSCKYSNCRDNHCWCHKHETGCGDQCSCYSCCNSFNEVINIENPGELVTDGTLRRSPRRRRRLRNTTHLDQLDTEVVVRIHFTSKTLLVSLTSKYIFYFGELLGAACKYWHLDACEFIIADADGSEWARSDDAIHELVIGKTEITPSKKAKLSRERTRVTRNNNAVEDVDGLPAVYIFPKPQINASKALGKRKRRSSASNRYSRFTMEATNSDTGIISEPECSVPTRKLPPRMARTVARGRNRMIPHVVRTKKRRRKRKSLVHSSDTSDTDEVSDDELLLSRNLSYLKHKSLENLLPLFDDYENYLGFDKEPKDIRNYSMSDHSGDEITNQRLCKRYKRFRSKSVLFEQSKQQTNSLRTNSMSTNSVPYAIPTDNSARPNFMEHSLSPIPTAKSILFQQQLDFCLSLPITIPSV